MGFFDFFKKKPEQQPGTLTIAPTQTGGASFYSGISDSLYACDIVLQSIRCKANEFKKLDPRHIRVVNGNQMTVHDSSIAHCLKRPNELMTTADMLERASILYELNKNAFIYPEYYRNKAGEKVYTGLYPLKPTSAEYQVDGKGKLYIHFEFASGYSATLPAADVIHWRKDYGANDYFGGSAGGGNDARGLLRTVREYEKLCQSIAKAIECSCQINGMVKINTYLADEKQEQEQAAFLEKLRNNESGVLFTDLKTEYIHMPRDIKLVDAETLNFFYSTITRANGVSLAILNGDYTKAQKEAFYEHALEADIKSLGQAFSKIVFSDRESAFGNDIVLYPNDITFMSMENKIAALQAGLPAGIFTKNEAREMLGFPPIEGGDAMPRGYNELDKGNEAQSGTSGEGEE